VLLAQCILSWIVGPMFQGRPNIFSSIYYFLDRITAPLIRPARTLLSRFNTGPIDFSLFLTIIFIYVIQRVLRVIVGIIL
jgi:uncharacterized protein YggT (Ycf19 family)